MDKHRVEIREFYNSYKPPRYVLKMVQALLDSVADKKLQGLECVVLTNQSGHPRRHRLGKVTSRKRRLPRSWVLGLYHPAHRGTLPWIELFVDNISARFPIVRWVPFIRDSVFGGVLFHEIGHHLHFTVAPEFREKEDVADDWKRKLSGAFLRRKYWYIRPIARPLRWLVKVCLDELKTRRR